MTLQQSLASSTLNTVTKEARDWRVGLVISDQVARNERGELLFYPTNGRLFDALYQRLPGARFCVNMVRKPFPDMTYALRCPPEDVVELPPLATTIEAQWHYFATRRILREFARTVDALYLRLPFQIPRVLRGLGKPKLLHVINDPVEFVRASCDYRGVMKFLARWYARHSEATMRQMASEPDSRTVTNGQAYWEKMNRPAGRGVVSSGIYEREIRPKTDLRLHNPPRLLFVGYLRPEKGALVLLDAFEQLRRRRPLQLTIVGDSDRPSQTEAVVNERINRSEYAADIRRVSRVEYGEALFDLYRQHDVFVLPSLAEGTPRTLVEARAFGCPVVASSVGGVPSSIRDGEDGLLVPPGDAIALSRAIDRLLSDEPLRLGLMEEGVRRARSFTLERYADQIVEELQLLRARSHRAAPSLSR